MSIPWGRADGRVCVDDMMDVTRYVGLARPEKTSLSEAFVDGVLARDIFFLVGVI